MKLPNFLLTLGVNSVPALGWFLGDWSPGTTLAVYWFETLAASLLIAARILIHRKVAPRRGHFKYQPPENANRRASPGSFLESYLPVALVFSAAHAVFLLVLVFVLTQNGRGAMVRLDFHQIGAGCLWISLLLAGNFFLDLLTIRKRPFRWIEETANRNLGRVIVVHMTIIVGMFVGVWTGDARGFFAVFIGLKTMLDLSNLAPQYNPPEAPRWLCAVMDRVPNVRKGESFAQFWRGERSGEAARLKRNEEPV